MLLLAPGQLRVLTVAFVGGPISGDRPDTKRTPFLLRMIRANLVEDRPDKLRMREEELERAARKGRNRRRPRPPRTPGKYDADGDVQTDCKTLGFDWPRVARAGSCARCFVAVASGGSCVRHWLVLC